MFVVLTAKETSVANDYSPRRAGAAYSQHARTPTWQDMTDPGTAESGPLRLLFAKQP